jgi:hypothetical protein
MFGTTVKTHQKATRGEPSVTGANKKISISMLYPKAPEGGITGNCEIALMESELR